MTQSREQARFRIGAALVIASGILTVTGAFAPLSGPMTWLGDLLVWPLDGAQTGQAAETRLLAAIGGGVMVGWGLMLWQLAGEMMARAPGPVRRIIRISIVAWFVLDSAGSLAAGAAPNLIGNLVFLALFLWPAPAARTRPA